MNFLVKDSLDVLDEKVADSKLDAFQKLLALAKIHAKTMEDRIYIDDVRATWDEFSWEFKSLVLDDIQRWYTNGSGLPQRAGSTRASFENKFECKGESKSQVPMPARAADWPAPSAPSTALSPLRAHSITPPKPTDAPGLKGLSFSMPPPTEVPAREEDWVECSL
jgi:hypothetical protein